MHGTLVVFFILIRSRSRLVQIFLFIADTVMESKRFILLIFSLLLPFVVTETDRYGNMLRSMPSLLKQTKKTDKLFIPSDIDMAQLYMKVGWSASVVE